MTVSSGASLGCSTGVKEVALSWPFQILHFGTAFLVLSYGRLRPVAHQRTVIRLRQFRVFATSTMVQRTSQAAAFWRTTMAASTFWGGWRSSSWPLQVKQHTKTASAGVATTC